jgi:hypothetical protein
MPLTLDPPHPFGGASGNTCLQGPSSLLHGGCVETPPDETYLGVTSTGETSLLHASLRETFHLPVFHDEILHEGTPLDGIDPSTIPHLHDETCHGSPHSLPGRCFHCPLDEG